MKLFFLVVANFACVVGNIQAQSDLDMLNWMIGKWQYQTTNYNIIEGWAKQNDTTMVGYSYTIAGSDTVSSEQTTIIKKKHKIIFNATVNEQNQNKTIPFLMYASSMDSIAFENSLHDFPQRIIYKKIDSQKLVARIEGKIEGREKSRNFYYQKIK